MLGAGTVINPIVKVVTTVATLAAVGFFIVRPVLDTTEKALDSAGAQLRESQRAGQRAGQAFDLDFARSRSESFAQSLQGTWPAGARAIKACIGDADGSAARMGRCDRLGERLVHAVQSDRSFAHSYADGLTGQGRGAEAERVRDCVARAGFRPARMERCRALADRLLFG